MSEKVAASDATELTKHETFADGPPYELFDELREQAPAVDSGKGPEGNQMWSVCRYADIAAISRDPETFSNHREGIFPHKDSPFSLALTQNLLLYTDPPEHTKYRKILQSAFTPNAVAKRQDVVRGIITDHIDNVIEAGECDFVQDIAVPYPLTVLMSLMGIPPDDIETFKGWIDRIEHAVITGEPDAANPVMVEMAPYLMEQIQRQKAEGGESVVTTLADAEVDGESLKDEEILVFFGLLAFAGNDTTRNTLSGGMRALLEHPDQLELLRNEPERIENAVEEILRWTTVVNYFCRTATKDTEVSGCPVGEGDKVMIWYAAGSRDPAANDDPHRFDVTREDIDHMAFGGGGRHFCLGSGLARQELRVAFEEILRRMKGIELAGEPTRLESNWAHAHTSMPIRFTPGEREGS